jgi:hypothetical protein
MLEIHEAALLIAVAIPVAAVAGLNLWLLVSGERGTLLLPHLGRFPTITLQSPQPVEDATIDSGIVVIEDEEPLRKAA